TPISLPVALHTVLEMRYNEASELSKTDMARASIIVRLHRRVQAFSGKTPVKTNVIGDFMRAAAPQQGEVPATEIDNVLAEAEVQAAAARDFLSGENGTLMGMA
ncbi:MAG: hypothetical protein Q9164_007764, partial [Protoblastenia rupestris]